MGAIVVAAGRGVRFGSETPKQFHSIAGVPIVLRALRHFTSHPLVAHVALVLPPEHAAHPPDFLSEMPAPSASSASCAFSVVPGGIHRGDSVQSGLAALHPECMIVLVHDGVRPFVDRSVIDRLIELARRGEGAVPAVPLCDTLKEVTTNDPTRIARTRPRAQLWRAQTPQAFPRRILEQAYARAAQVGRRATDDAALVEAMGVTVRLVPDSTRNIKITTSEDLALGELLAGEAR